MIPKVEKVWAEFRPADAEIVHLPTNCPVCESPVVMPEGEALARCSGGLYCAAQRIEAIRHFVSRKALDIEGLGDRWVESLLHLDLLKEFKRRAAKIISGCKPKDWFWVHKVQC